MAIGRVKVTQPGDMRTLKRALKETSGGDKYFWKVPQDDRITFRIMVEPYEFTKFDQHSVGTGQDYRSFPCNSGDCEGCDEGYDVYPVWVAPVVDTENSRVRVLRMPKTIVNSLTKRCDVRGTVLDRDWTVLSEGSGRDTKYELIENDRRKRDLSIYEMPDIEGMIERQLREALGLDDDDDEEDEPPRRNSRGAAKKAARRPANSRNRRPADDEDDEEEEEDEAPWDEEDDEEEEAPPRRSLAKKASKKVLAKKTLPRTPKRTAPTRKGLRR